jgi:hypothetical protein
MLMIIIAAALAPEMRDWENRDRGDRVNITLR